MNLTMIYSSYLVTGDWTKRKSHLVIRVTDNGWLASDSNWLARQGTPNKALHWTATPPCSVASMSLVVRRPVDSWKTPGDRRDIPLIYKSLFENPSNPVNLVKLSVLRIESIPDWESTRDHFVDSKPRSSFRLTPPERQLINIWEDSSHKDGSLVFWHNYRFSLVGPMTPSFLERSCPGPFRVGLFL